MRTFASLALGTAVIALMAPQVIAQSDDPVDAVLDCRTIADPAQRLACFDRSSATLQTARDAGEVTTITRADVESFERDSFGFNIPSLPRLSLPFRNRSSEPAAHDALEGVESAQAPATPAAPATPPATAAAQPTGQPTAPAPAETPVAQAPASPAPATPTPATPPAAAEAPEPPMVEIIARDDDGSVDAVRMRIVRTRTVGYNTTLFYMENGQVWRQLDDDRVRMPRGDDDVYAEIRRGAMDGYLLRINGRGRAIRVRRQE